MFSALISFFGGAAFRYVIGRALDWLEKRQEFLQEQARLEFQEKIDASRFSRQMESIRLQAELKVQQVKVEGEAAEDLESARAFTEAMKVANVKTGNVYIDAWNGSIRPAAASVALGLWVLKIARAWFELTAWDMDLISAILGYYFADRHMGKPRVR